MVNEIEMKQSLVLIDSILSRVETEYTEKLIDRCKPYQIEVRSNHVLGIFHLQPDLFLFSRFLVDDENRVFVKLFATEREATTPISSDQAVEKIKSEIIAILGNLPVKNILNRS